MSLQVWLPLNGTLENLGLNPVLITNNNATIDNNGKMGKCYTFGGGAYLSSTITMPTTSWSMACWFYPTVSSSSGHQYMISINNSTSDDFLGTIACYADKLVARTKGTTYSGTAITLNTWQHGAVTYGNNILKLYLNGTLVLTQQNPVAPVASTTLRVGDRGGNAGRFNGKLNDVRVYDHCLSPKEVKEISKGLVLHYRLSGPGGENLKKNSESPSFGAYSGTTVTKTTNVSVSEWNCTNAVRHVGTSGTSGIAFTFGDGITSINGQKYTFSGYIKNDSNIAIGITGNTGGSISIPAKTSQYFSFTGTGNGSSYIQFNTSMTAGSSYDITVWHYKIEYGERATPWCPNSADAIYASFSPTTEWDCAIANTYDGIKAGTISWDGDTPRYSSSYKFTSGAYIGLEKIPLNTSMTDFTFSFWMKTSTPSNTMCFWNGRTTTGGPIGIFDIGAKFRFDDGGQHTFSSYTIPSNTWGHYVFTRDASSIKLYVNGVLKETVSATAFSTIGDKATIGASSANTATGSGNNFVGNLSDYRIYTTCLSVDDIAELYHTAAIMDNGYNAFSYEFIE